jgi:hypothetical protein
MLLSSFIITALSFNAPHSKSLPYMKYKIPKYYACKILTFIVQYVGPKPPQHRMTSQMLTTGFKGLAVY